MDPRLRTPALRGDLAAVNRALDDGADPNLADPDGYNPLIYAAEGNQPACAARLIEAGVRVDCHTFEGRTPLNIAARYGYADMIRVLLASGAQIDVRPTSEEYGITWSPMHFAMYHGHHAAMSALLAAGADPNQQRETDENWSPLVSAVENTERYRNFFLYDTMNGGKSRCSNYILPSLLRAGASINHPGITRLFRALNDPDRSLRPAQRKPVEYLQAVQAAGGFPAYARAHRSRFAAIFSRGTRLPVDVIPTIVDYWAHLGWYKYE